MIIKSIRVENFRSIREPMSLEFCDGVNVICGDNGDGKSTIMEALRMGFFDRHSASGEEVKKKRPWGCELAPRVQIEFSHGGVDYRLTKQFINSKSSLVERVVAKANELRGRAARREQARALGPSGIIVDTAGGRRILRPNGRALKKGGGTFAAGVAGARKRW